MHAPSTAPAVARAVGRLWWCVVLMALPATMFAVAYPLARHASVLTDIGKLSEYRPAAFVAYLGGLAVMFIANLVGLRAARVAGRQGLWPVLGGGIAVTAVIALMYPVNAIDLFIYAVRSRIFTSYGLNPQAVAPSAITGDPQMAFASAEWSVTVSPYGPLWHLIAAPITALAGDNLTAALFGFKALAALAVIAGAILIGLICRAAGLPAAAGVLLYLWNPLVLWEGVGNGHNDVVMLVPLLGALLAWQTRRDLAVIPLLAVAVCIKYVALVALPVALVALWRRHAAASDRMRLAAGSLGLSLLVGAIALAPFFDPGAVWFSVRQQGAIFLTSPAAVGLTLLRDRLGDDRARLTVILVGGAIFALAALAQLRRVWHAPPRFPAAVYETMFALLLVATWNFRPWYVIWLVGLAAALPPGWPAWRALAWSAGGLAGYGVFIWIWEWWPVAFPEIQRVGVLVMTGPALVLTLIALWRARQVASSAPS